MVNFHNGDTGMSIRRPMLTFVAALAALLTCIWPAAVSASPDFFKAVRKDDLAAVERHLAMGVASNVLSASLIHAETEEMARALLLAGADPEVFVRDGGNALHWAAYHGKTGVVRALVAGEADVNAAMTSPSGFKNERDTALHLALWKSRSSTPEIVRMLIEAGADPNSMSSWGATPLHAVAKFGRDADIINLLLDAGADPLLRLTSSRRGDDGKTPLDLARKFNPRILRTDAGRRLHAATRRAGMDEPGCDGVIVQPSDTKLSYLAERTLGKASRWKEIVELNGLEGKGYRAGDCLMLP